MTTLQTTKHELMKRLMPVAILAILLLAAGCKKKKGEDAPASYMPNTANSSWNYDTKTYAPAAATSSYTLKATNKDTTIGSRTYRVYNNTGGQNDYYAQVGSDYYQYASLGGIGGQRVETLYLKDGAAGTTWSETQNITLGTTAVSVAVNYQIAEKGITYTTNGKTYNDVTHVKATLGTITVPGLPIPITPVSDNNFYYARGIGRIYSRAKVTIAVPLVSLNFSTDEELLLKTYTIQ